MGEFARFESRRTGLKGCVPGWEAAKRGGGRGVRGSFGRNMLIAKASKLGRGRNFTWDGQAGLGHPPLEGGGMERGRSAR